MTGRRFTLLDAMIAIAAIAAELALIRALDLGFRWDFHSKLWTQTRFFFHSWMINQWIDQIFSIATVTGLCLTVSTLAFRLRRPRPKRRRLVGQPGMAAILAAVAAWLTLLPGLVLWRFELPNPNPYAVAHFGMHIDLVPALAGFGVTAWWGMLLLSRRWRSEPSWIDRLGRLVGVGWIALGLWGLYLRTVC